MLGLLVTGCSGGSSDGGETRTASEAPASPSAAAKEKGAEADPAQAAYFACIEARGVPMRDTGSGVPVVDEAAADPAEVKEAEAACADKLAVPDADAEELAVAQAFTDCMREHGVEDFPDPDPKTGDHEGLESLDLKTSPEGVAATKACRVGKPGTGGKVGG